MRLCGPVATCCDSIARREPLRLRAPSALTPTRLLSVCLVRQATRCARRLLMGRRRLAHTNAHRKASNKCYNSCRPRSTAFHWFYATRQRGTTALPCSLCRGGELGVFPRGSTLGSRPIAAMVSIVLLQLVLASASRTWRSRVPSAAGTRAQCLTILAG